MPTVIRDDIIRMATAIVPDVRICPDMPWTESRVHWESYATDSAPEFIEIGLAPTTPTVALCGLTEVGAALLELALLHECGHVATDKEHQAAGFGPYDYGHDPNATFDSEARAWHWALDNYDREISAGTWHEIRVVLGSYIKRWPETAVQVPTMDALIRRVLIGSILALEEA